MCNPSFCGLSKQGKIKVGASTESLKLETAVISFVLPLFVPSVTEHWQETLLSRRASSGHLSSWSLNLVLQVSKGSSYYTAWCYPVGAYSGTLCVAGPFLSCVPGWELRLSVLRGKLILKRRAGCCFGILFWDSVWSELYRWIWDVEKKALMKSPI